MGIFCKYVCFNLNADNEQEIEKSNQIIRKLKNAFGEKAVEVTPLKTIIIVEIANGSGWIIPLDKQHNGKDTLYIQVTTNSGSSVTTLCVEGLESITRL